MNLRGVVASSSFKFRLRSETEVCTRKDGIGFDNRVHFLLPRCLSDVKVLKKIVAVEVEPVEKIAELGEFRRIRKKGLLRLAQRGLGGGKRLRLLGNRSAARLDAVRGVLGIRGIGLLRVLLVDHELSFHPLRIL